MEGWVSRCKLLYMEWISNRVLLNSTENYIQYPITGMEKNVKKKRMHAGKMESPCYKKKKRKKPLSPSLIIPNHQVIPFLGTTVKRQGPLGGSGGAPTKSSEAHAFRHHPPPMELELRPGGLRPVCAGTHCPRNSWQGPETPPRPDGGGRQKGTERQRLRETQRERKGRARKTKGVRSRGRERPETSR